MALAEKEFQGRGFRVVVGEQQVVMIVDPVASAAMPVTLDEVRVFFAKQGWPWQSSREIEAALAKSDGCPHVIVDNLADIRLDAQLHIRVSEDQMRAIARVSPAIWGEPITKAAVLRQLAELGISYGVQNEVIEQMVLQQTLDQEWIIALGRPTEKGANARLEYDPILQKTGGKPTFLPDGRVDFRELNNIVVVSQGQLLATRIPPTAGIPGRNIFGEELPAVPGRDLVWPIGKGVSVENNRLIATVDGQVVLKLGRINVLPVYEIPGDVDYSVGNIRFNGNVQIRGSVKPGFTIQAEGDVKISGGVDSANITCGGTLTVGGGIQGQGRGEIKVEGDIYCRFIENCKATAGGAIVVGEDIMHSQVFAGRSIQVGGRKGLIVGGVIRATDSIECKVLGAAFGTPTTLEVGVNPSLFEQFSQLQAAMAKIENELTRLKQGITRLEQLQATTGSLPPSRQELLNQLTRAHDQRSQELSNIAWQLAQQEQAMAAIKNANVKVSDTVYTGVKVTIGKSVYHVREQKRGGIFKLEEGDVIFRSQ